MSRFLTPVLVILCWLCWAVAVPNRNRDSPVQTCNVIRRAVGREDVAAFRARLSAETIAFLRKEWGRTKVEPALSFMLHRLKAAGPFQVVHQRHTGSAALLRVKGNGWQDEWRFVKQGGTWKLDLVEAYRAWKRFAEWTRQVEDNMRRTAPLLGCEGPGPGIAGILRGPAPSPRKEEEP
jgi:hypothetical protein